MGRRNAQDQYEMANRIREEMRDVNRAPEPTPQSRQPAVVIRRQHEGGEARIVPATPWAHRHFQAQQVRRFGSDHS